MTARPRTTDSAVELLDALAGDDPEMQRSMEEETINPQIACLVYDVREATGLTKRELAKRVGTTQSSTSRLEDADYRGHSVTMLQRIAKALDLQLSLQFVPLPRRARQRKAAAAT